MKILRNEFILPFIDGKECHAGHLTLLGDGNVFCVFFYGSKEGNDDVRIFGSLRTPDAKWSEPQPITEDDGLPHWNPILQRRSDGSIVLYYKVGKTIAGWQTRYKISYDECKTWSESYELVPGDISGGRGPVRNKVITLSDKRMIAPGSTEIGEWKCFFDVSSDNGNSWVRTDELRIFDGEYDESHKGRGIIQPTLWQSPDGIHALMRSTEGVIYRADSQDGYNWCRPYVTNMPNNNSGIDVAVLPDGRLILACNPVGDNWGKRTPLSLYVSSDNGQTFELLTHLITMKGEYAYPTLIFDNGCLHIVYTWNRKTMTYMCLGDI